MWSRRTPIPASGGDWGGAWAPWPDRLPPGRYGPLNEMSWFLVTTPAGQGILTLLPDFKVVLAELQFCFNFGTRE